jgi:Flp pilus assembly protein protease CpaA
MLLDPTLIAIIVFGIITSYTDIKKAKIKNIHIILLLLAGLLVNSFYTHLFLKISLDVKSDFIQSIANVLIAFAFGFSLFSAGLWSSGDAKLFLGYALLLPVFTYKYGYIQYFPSLVILINTFIPLAFFYIIISFFNINLKSLKKEAKETLSPSSFLNIILFIFAFQFLLSYGLKSLKISLDMFTQTFLLFILMEITNKFKKNYVKYFLVLISLLRILFFFSQLITLSFLQNFLISIFMFQILRFVISYLVDFSLTETVKIDDLKPGMLLGESLIKTKKGYEKKQKTLVTIFDIFRSVKEGIMYDVSSHLTENDVQTLKALQKEKKLDFDTVKISKTVPFAPFMFFGVLTTYLLKGSIFYYLLLAGSMLKL